MKYLILIYVVTVSFYSCTNDKITGRYKCIKECYDGPYFTLYFTDTHVHNKHEDGSGVEYPFSVKEGFIHIRYSGDEDIVFEIIDKETIKGPENDIVWKGLYKKESEEL